MLNRLGRAVSAANPASHADKRMDAATGKLSIPRFQVMSPAQLDAFTKAGPPNGVFVYTMSPDGSEDELQQWVKDHWEVVGKVYIGENAKTDDIVKRVTPAAFSMGAGGSGVGVAPRQPGDPSITEPMSGVPPTQWLQYGPIVTPVTTFTTQTDADGEVLLATIPISGPVPPPLQVGLWVISLLVDVASPPVAYKRRVYLNATVVDDGVNSTSVAVDAIPFGVNVGDFWPVPIVTGDVITITLEVLVPGSVDWLLQTPSVWFTF